VNFELLKACICPFIVCNFARLYRNQVNDDMEMLHEMWNASNQLFLTTYSINFNLLEICTYFNMILWINSTPGFSNQVVLDLSLFILIIGDWYYIVGKLKVWCVWDTFSGRIRSLASPKVETAAPKHQILQYVVNRLVVSSLSGAVGEPPNKMNWLATLDTIVGYP